MTIFRFTFAAFAIAAVSGTAYISYHGAGGESSDLDKSVRSASAGRVIGVAGRVK